MKNVILVGDSIRMGYQEVVRELLRGVADVSWPQQNGHSSQYVLDHLREWVIERAADLIHVNAGLHDLKVDRATRSHQVPLAQYGRNVRRILEDLMRRTSAKVIWATCTPVNEVWHNAHKPFDRYEADVIAYNQQAMGICRQLGVPIDDLYDVVLRAGPDGYLQADGVHFTDAGCRLLGEAVAGVIRANL